MRGTTKRKSHWVSWGSFLLRDASPSFDETLSLTVYSIIPPSSSDPSHGTDLQGRLQRGDPGGSTHRQHLASGSSSLSRLSLSRSDLLLLRLTRTSLPTYLYYQQNVTSNGSVANILPKKIGLTSKADLVNAVRPTHPSWSPEVAVLCTEWNSSCGLGRAGMLASGMACGFARVDMLEGRWRGGKLPPAALKDLRLGLKD